MIYCDLFGNPFEKLCSRCGQIKPIGDFRERKRGYGVKDCASYCKACHTQDSRSRYIYGEEQQADKRKHAYKISKADWDQLFREQGRKCACCGATEHGGRGWHTDHCHKSMKVRGILCQSCNLALGQLKDDPSRALSLVAYLQKHQVDS